MFELFQPHKANKQPFFCSRNDMKKTQLYIQDPLYEHSTQASILNFYIHTHRVYDHNNKHVQ